MALWSKKSRKRKTQPTSENTTNTNPQKQRKLSSPEAKLLAVKALEEGLTSAEVSEIVGAGNSSVTARARAFREGSLESLVRKSTSATTRRICEKLERRIEQERRENPQSGVRRIRDELKKHEGLGISAETVRRVVNDAGLGNPPVVAAGGIGDARGGVASFALGAEGVAMGTRFVATSECPVPSCFKERVCAARSDETFVVEKKAMPVRVLRNNLTERMEGLGEEEADELLNTAGDASHVQAGGNRESAAMPCGQSVGVVRKIQNLSQVFNELTGEAEAISERLGVFFRGGER